MCNFLKTPIGAASPSSPTLLPTLGEGGKNLLKLPLLLALGEEGWGGEGNYSCTWREINIQISISSSIVIHNQGIHHVNL
jgi:hypothetical protein